MPHPPAIVAGVGEGYSSSGTHWALQRAFTSTPQVFSAPGAFTMAGLSPADVDVLTVYDPFTVVSLMQIEDMGFCPKGEAGRGRVGLLDGVYGGLAESDRDIFADPHDDVAAESLTRLRVVLLRDGGLTADDEEADGEPMAVEERRADAVQRLAERRGVRVSVVTAEGASALERLASLVAVPDFASVYLGFAHGLDPIAVPAVSEMKELVSP